MKEKERKEPEKTTRSNEGVKEASNGFFLRLSKESAEC